MTQYSFSWYPLPLASSLPHRLRPRGRGPLPSLAYNSSAIPQPLICTDHCLLLPAEQKVLMECNFIWSQKMQCSYYLPTKARLFPPGKVKAKIPNSISSLQSPYLLHQALPPHQVLTDLVAPSMSLGTYS